MSGSDHGVPAQASEPTTTAVRVSVAARVQRVLMGLLPWAIIGGLLYAGFFIELSPVGQTVQPPPLEPRDQYYGIAAPAPGVLWMAGSYGKVVRSEDGGATWVKQDTPIASHLQDIAVWDAERAVAVGNGGLVIVTDDAGAHWTEVAAPKNDVANKLIRVRTGAAGAAWTVGEYGTLLHSSDYGRTWSRLSEPRDITYEDLAILSDGTLLVVAEFGRLFASHDGGASWSEVETPDESSLTGIAFKDDRNGVAVGLGGVILVSRDGGASWERQERVPTGISAAAEPGQAPVAIQRQELVGDIVSEHLLAVAWVPARQQWVTVGNKGVVVVGSADMNHWETRQLAARDVAWHTAIAVDGDDVYFAGRNAGRWTRNGEWQVFFGRKG